jgi:S1-C subfamily serine protease
MSVNQRAAAACAPRWSKTPTKRSGLSAAAHPRIVPICRRALVLVAETQPDSPAAKAGIVAGDIITTFAGQPASDDRDLIKRVGDIPLADQSRLV